MTLTKRVIPCLDVANGRVVKVYILNQLKMQVILFYWLKNIAMKVQMNLSFLTLLLQKRIEK